LISVLYVPTWRLPTVGLTSSVVVAGVPRTPFVRQTSEPELGTEVGFQFEAVFHPPDNTFQAGALPPSRVHGFAANAGAAERHAIAKTAVAIGIQRLPVPKKVALITLLLAGEESLPHTACRG